MVSYRMRMAGASLALCFGLAFSAVAFAQSAQPVFKPYHADGFYAVGETVGWTVTLPAGGKSDAYSVRFLRNMKEPISGHSSVVDGATLKVETASAVAGMITVEVLDASGARVARAGAAVSPTGLKPTAEKPADFDAFWAEKLKALRAVPMKPERTPIASGNPAVEEYAVTLNGLHSHVHGYLARPTGAGKHPALLIYQYAGVYALDPKTAAWRASQGWLTFNVSSHDLPPDQATGLRGDYPVIGNADRETSYFLEMYLRDTRALDYVTTLPDWDGKTLVINGASMGGQQGLVTAALNADKTTAVIVNEPAGSDVQAERNGRKAGYPNWPADDPKVMQTALYFDPVNFAAWIKAFTVVSVGFLDETVTPAGVWTMYNQIAAPKEMVPMIDADHMHVTPDKVGPIQKRTEEALSRLVKGESAAAGTP